MSGPVIWSKMNSFGPPANFASRRWSGTDDYDDERSGSSEGRMETRARTVDISARLFRLMCVSALAVMASCAATTGVASLLEPDTTPSSGLPREARGKSAETLSAFFGLDNTLPRTANRICQDGAGLDGMPVVFSTEIDHTTLQAGDFQVTTQSGRVGSVHCASFLPATDAGELRTVLLMGEFGDAETDPPATGRIVGHLHSIDGTLDFQGASVAVTPLEPGPSLVLAEVFSAEIPDVGLGLRRTNGSACPDTGVMQAVRVVWAGGVTMEDGSKPSQTVGQLYQVTVQSSDGARRVVTPVALADIDDGDNNHLLCLDTADMPVAVSFPAGVLADPNDDANPATAVSITRH